MREVIRMHACEGRTRIRKRIRKRLCDQYVFRNSLAQFVLVSLLALLNIDRPIKLLSPSFSIPPLLVAASLESESAQTIHEPNEVIVEDYVPPIEQKHYIRGGDGRRNSNSNHSLGSIRRQQKSLTLNQIFIKAGKHGLGGGIPGAIAGIIQVLTLMWLRTIMTYQCRYGTTFLQALRTLLNEGGISRLYQGWYFGMIQAPVTRFASTAANDGVESLLSSLELTKTWGPGRSTIIASFLVGLFRMVLMPIDTMKVVLQVDGSEGFRNLLRRLRAGKISALYQGCLATALASMMGHYPWFFTYNWLSAQDWIRSLLPSSLVRNAGIGLAASIVSDVMVNAIRVIKTTKQSLGSHHSVTYNEAVRVILAADGWKGLFGRGLNARIYCNAIQSIIFTVVWRALADRWHKKKQSSTLDEAITA